MVLLENITPSQFLVVIWSNLIIQNYYFHFLPNSMHLPNLRESYHLSIRKNINDSKNLKNREEIQNKMLQTIRIKESTLIYEEDGIPFVQKLAEYINQKEFFQQKLNMPKILIQKILLSLFRKQYNYEQAELLTTINKICCIPDFIFLLCFWKDPKKILSLLVDGRAVAKFVLILGNSILSQSFVPQYINLYLTPILQQSIFKDNQKIQNTLWLISVIASYGMDLEITQDNILGIMSVLKIVGINAYKYTYMILDFLYETNGYVDLQFFQEYTRKILEERVQNVIYYHFLKLFMSLILRAYNTQNLKFCKHMLVSFFYFYEDQKKIQHSTTVKSAKLAIEGIIILCEEGQLRLQNRDVLQLLAVAKDLPITLYQQAKKLCRFVQSMSQNTSVFKQSLQIIRQIQYKQSQQQ